MVREERVLRRGLALADVDAESIVTGVGPWPSGFSLPQLTEASQNVDCIMAFGFAGGLDPSLKPGDLVTATRIHEEGGPPIGCDREMLDAVETVASESGCRSLPEYTSRRPVCTLSDKRDLFDRTGASFVTMEDYYFAKEASRLGVPFISVRAIVDSADQRVPPPVAAIGGVSHARQAVSGLAYAVTHPWHVPALMALGAGASRAASALERFLQAYISIMTQTTHGRRDVALSRP